MSRIRGLLALLFLLIGLIYGPFINGQTSSGTSPFEVPSDLDLTGVWAMVQITSEIVKIPIVGNRTRTNTTHLRLIIEQSDDALSVLETNCGTDIDDGTMMVNTTIPDAFLLSLGVTERTARLELVSETDPSTGNAAPECRIVFPWNTQVLGARLEDPDNEALPMDAADPRVFDQDNDGHPGMTVRVGIMGLINGEVYVVQRNRNRLTGKVISPGFIRGTIEWETEQVILGASSPFLASGGQGSPDPDPERNFFLARRIDPLLDCADIQQMDLLLWED
ncbi:hypothetical protein ACFLS0_00095 [Candidatus Bipolaricaulota bacterium]